MKKFLAIGMVTAIVAFAFIYGCTKNPVGTGSAPSVPTLSSPANGANVSMTPTLVWIWNSSSGATSYNLQIAADSSFSSIIYTLSTLTTTSITISTSLTGGKKYYWRINAANTNGISNWSAAWSFITPAAVPTNPTVIAPTSKFSWVAFSYTTGKGTLPLTFSVTDSNGATDTITYTLFIGSSAGSLTNVYTGKNQTFNLINVDSSKTVYWKIIAKDLFGDSAIGTGYFNAPASPSLPLAPTLSSPSNVALTFINPTLIWNNTAASAISCHLQIATDTAFTSIILNDSMLTSNSMAVSSLLADSTKFYWRVNATNAAGTSGWSAVGSFTIIILASPVSAGTVTDADGNVYHTVKIGNQVWTVENLRTTKYNDGSSIPLDTSTATWVYLTTPAYCYYNNTTNAGSINKFGALYNWYTVNTGKLAPTGWHVPTDAEWEVMQSYLVLHGYNYDGTTDTSTYNKIAIALAAKTDWYSDTVTGTIGKNLTNNNSSGFSALPGSCRSYTGLFGDVGYRGNWWSATEAWGRVLIYDYGIYRYGEAKSSGLSVRLVRDN